MRPRWPRGATPAAYLLTYIDNREKTARARAESKIKKYEDVAVELVSNAHQLYTFNCYHGTLV